MTQSKLANDTTGAKTKKSAKHKAKPARMAPASNGEILVKGVVMGFIISGVTHASKSITRALVSHPLALFSTGLVTGYLTHKYRKEIIVLGNKTAVESKNFVLRQRENLGDLIAEIKAESGEMH
ncbi:hypothetical protein QZJ86_14415 [Methylomonas montana]|uniref:hypothetical protein n=1 Tax=Methylomonas montana TaxID=3058963 RepID=UPI0026597B96|nr:hypothetical protein [Methylomonas montana]WKJ89211.1 hypothetical protein QZJ86_14415 [Methylomonas montana]